MSSEPSTQPLALNRVALETFWQGWFGNIDEGYIEIRPQPDKPDYKSNRAYAAALNEANQSFPADHVDDLLNHIESIHKNRVLNGKTGYFWGVSPRNRTLSWAETDGAKKRVGGRDADVEQYIGAWADVDEHDDEDKKHVAHALDVIELLNQMGFLPTFKIRSGGGQGFHLYYKFMEPVEAAEGRAIVSKLAMLLQSDTTIANPSRIMRIPGTIHSKSGELIPVSIEEHNDISHHFSDFDEAIDTLLERFHVEPTESSIGRAAVYDGQAWDPMPVEAVRQKLPEVCARFALYASNPNAVKEIEWAFMASTIRSLSGDAGFELFDEWSQNYAKGSKRYTYKETLNKWASKSIGNPPRCATYQAQADRPECKACPFFEKDSSPNMRLRTAYGQELGLGRAFGAPSYIETLRQGCKSEGVEFIADHPELVEKARQFEANEFALWTQGEGLALDRRDEFEVDSDYDDYLSSLGGAQKPKLVVDNSEKLKTTEEQLEQLMAQLRDGALSGPKAADQAIPLFVILAQANERQAKIYARAFVKADKTKSITEKIIWDATREEIENEAAREKQERREKQRQQAKQKNAYDADQTGFQRHMAEQWALSNQERFIHWDQKGAPHYLKLDLAKALKADFHMHAAFDGVFSYNGKHYEETEKPIKGFIQDVYHAISATWGDSALAESTYRTLTMDLESIGDNDPTSWYDRWDAQPYTVFQNGVLDMSDPAWPVLIPFSPNYRCTWMVECDWDPNTKNADVDQYLQSTLPDPVTRQSLLEYLGYTMCRFDQSQQRYALLYGSGRNGKGLFINVLNRLFKKSSATCSLKELADNRFSAYQLLRSAVNIVGDMSGERLESTEMLKQITGNDTISAEQKFKAQFRFKPRTKLVFALNELPSTSDPSHGFFRRPLVYPFKQRFEGSKKDLTLEARITTPEALSYWAFLAISAYGAMQARAEKVIIESDEMIAMLNDYRKANDIVAMAVEDGIIEFGEDFMIPRELLHLAFEVYAESLGRKSPASNKLIERVRNAPEAGQIKETRVGPAGKQIKMWKGIRLGGVGKLLRKEKEFIDQDTQKVIKASTPIEEFYERL